MVTGIGFYIFQKELRELGLEVKFFNKLSKKFLDSDYLFFNSRSLNHIMIM
jgi:hypothetical protein